MRWPPVAKVGSLAVGAVAVAVAVVSFASSQKKPTDCTEVGCESTVKFELSSVGAPTLARASVATLCVNGQCTITNLPAALSDSVQTVLDDRVVESASITIFDETGMELVHDELVGEHRAHAFTPNGPDCEPTCWLLDLSMVDGVLTAQ